MNHKFFAFTLLLLLLLSGDVLLSAQASSARPLIMSDFEPANAITDQRLAPFASGGAAFMIDSTLADNNPYIAMRYIPDINKPKEWEYVGYFPENVEYFAGDFVGNDISQMYVIDFSRNELHAVKTRPNNDLILDDTLIGACTPLEGQAWTGATGTRDGILYASSTNEETSYLYTIDLDTGTATLVGEITNAPGIIDIAINTDSEMYGLDINNNTLVQIDPATGVGTVIGAIGFDADFAQGMDFEDTSGVLYLAAVNLTSGRGELRIADTATGETSLVGVFDDEALVDSLAFTPQPAQIILNPGFEDGWQSWLSVGYPMLSSSTTHNGSAQSADLLGEDIWVVQPVSIPADAVDVTFSYWTTGLSGDPIWDNDILCGGIWDQTLQTRYARACFDLAYFYSYPKDGWLNHTYRLKTEELDKIAGKEVVFGFNLTQDWVSGYSNTSIAWVDDAALYVTRDPRAPTSITLVSDPNPSMEFQLINFTATLAAEGNPSGEITFYDGENSLGSAIIDSNGVASFSQSGFIAGTHTIIARYDGEQNFAPGISNPVQQEVIHPGNIAFTIYLPSVIR